MKGSPVRSAGEHFIRTTIRRRSLARKGLALWADGDAHVIGLRRRRCAPENWGMAVICDPVNKCIDPNADTIEHHPDLVKAVEQRDALLAALQNSDHSPKCAVRDRDAFDDREPCSCGRDAAIAEAQP